MRPGIDVLLDDSLHLVAGQRIGLLTNAAGIDRAGVGDLERLLSDGLQVTAIFSPEHGYRILRDGLVGDGRDSATGVPIFSLYGATRRPTPVALDLIDLMVIDLPDIGARTYTYASTMLLAMEAAGAAATRVIVLDRPNPIGGVQVQGPVLDTTHASFVGMLSIPMRHGLTLGEIALLGRAIRGIDVELTVVPVAGWNRSTWFDQTGLPWAKPSPSMPDLESATHYPGVVIFEATTMSVGRGTPIAFQLIGAPWLDVASVLGDVGPFPGVALIDTMVTPHEPADGKFGGEQLRAIGLRVIDRSAYDPVATSAALFLAVGKVHPDAMAPDSARLARLWGSPELWLALMDSRGLAQLVDGWQARLRAFRRTREPYLLYR